MRADALKPWRPGVDGPWDLAAAAHLLGRAGFGAGREELERAAERGLEATLGELVSPPGHDPALVAGARAVLGSGSLESLQAWWMALILGGGDPLGERLTLFWHDHFATSNDKVGDVRMMHAQNELFRARGRGDFRELLHAVARGPAMLVWLDGNDNRNDHPNENFAREVMELFALGIGNYTEDDVLEAARAFSGWGTEGRSFKNRPRFHDAGEKRVLGERGNFDGQAVLDVILAQPACPRHVARRLLEEYVAAPVDERTVRELARVLVEGEWHVGRTLETLLRSRLFFSREARHARIAGPVELVARTLRLTAARVAPAEAARAAARMGQALFRPPSVKGWDGGRAWIHAGTWLARHDLLTRVALEGERGDLERALGPASPRSELAVRVARTLLQRDAGRAYTDELERCADAAGSDGEALARVTALILSSPEYHLA